MNARSQDTRDAARDTARLESADALARAGIVSAARSEGSAREWIGSDVSGVALIESALQVAATSANVFLTGERGVGKEWLARFIHAHSEQSSGPFISLNCAALDQVVLNAELFGSDVAQQPGWVAPGVGLLERAAGGVLYLQEISALSRALQARLARALIERSFERLGSLDKLPLLARVVAGARQDLRREVAEGRFDDRLRSEFGAHLDIPALRDRPRDTTLLAEHFLRHFARAHDRALTGFTAEALELLTKYEWPGNVRQLRNVVERAVVASTGTAIEPHDLASEISQPHTSDIEADDDESISLDVIEKRHIRRVLEKTGGRLMEAAELLGIHRNTLRRKLEQYGLTQE